MDLTPENIFGLLQSAEEFPVDFDHAWQWIGYGRKSDAKAALLNAGFIAGTDFQILRNTPQNSQAGRPSELICLTVDCFKSFAMMAGTAKGKEVRGYFLRCEKELKVLLAQRHENHRQRVIKAVVQDSPDPWVKRYEDEFFEEAYRITGRERPTKGHPSWMGTFINETIYDHFPSGVNARLRQVNPKNPKGNRPRKLHQHLTPELGVPILATHKAATIAVMRLSPSGDLKRFQANMAKACGDQIQIELPFMDDFNQLGEAS